MKESPSSRAISYHLAAEGYAEHWQEEADNWQKTGFYKRVAETLEWTDGHLHIDFGSGLCHLGRAIRRVHPQGSIIGIERNPIMARKALELNKRSNLKSQLYDNSELSAKGSNITRIFEPDEETPTIDPDSILIVVDDVRNMRIVKKILGNREINSGTLTLAGASPEMITETVPRGTLTTGGTELKIKNQIMMQVRRSADELMTRQAKPGSSYTLADRLGVEGKYEDPQEVIRSFFQTRFGKLAPHWDIEPSELIDIPQIQTPLNWSPNALTSGGEMPKDAKLKLAITKLRRNRKKY